MPNIKLAEILFPDVKLTIEDLENRYPKRNLPEGAMVTRFGPSPTGYVHIGGLLTTLVNERLAHQTKGVLYLRIEDTDRKREVEGAVEGIIAASKNFRVEFDEGAIDDEHEKGEYGPYTQSKREEIYKAVAKFMVEKGIAYPCFRSPEDLDKLRKQQESAGIRPGYYGKWAVDRNLSFEEVEDKIKQGLPYIIRFKSPGSEENRIVCNDIIRGSVEMQENDQDIVLIKSDGLPQYHLAHVVDDHFMRTTHVIRADEWLPSLPLHLQLFQTIGWEPPKYAHISPIVKEDGSSKRKLSKRKDPEAAVSFYFEQGYPSQSIKEYLLTLINSNFEDWRIANPKEPCENFIVTFEKMSTSGALLDINKLNDISKNVISKMSIKEMYWAAFDWAKIYDIKLSDLMNIYKDYTRAIFNIERDSDRPRKDIGKWSDVWDNINYFYDEIFYNWDDLSYDFSDKLSKEDIKNILREYINIYNENDDKETWFNNLKELAGKLGFAKETKEYKKNPEAFKGAVGDVAMVVRVALAKRNNTPDLHEMMSVMGRERILDRFKGCIDSL